MKKINIFIISLLLINFYANGQNSVKVFAGRASLKTQKILDLSYRNLRNVPPIPFNEEIEVLILDNNNIEMLPSWIANLKNLKILSVRNNNLMEMNFLQFCDNLEQLYLSGNPQLTYIESLSACEKLELIDVIDTGISELPGWVNTMDNLHYFKFSEKK